MHTEVDVPNPDHVLMPGLYAEAMLLSNIVMTFPGASAGHQS